MTANLDTPLHVVLGDRGWYFVQSPTAFRRRMIFTEAEPLRRARMPHPAFHPRDVARGYRWTEGALQGVFGPQWQATMHSKDPRSGSMRHHPAA